jgi:hypothetical protein
MGLRPIRQAYFCPKVLGTFLTSFFPNAPHSDSPPGEREQWFCQKALRTFLISFFPDPPHSDSLPQGEREQWFCPKVLRTFRTYFSLIPLTLTLSPKGREDVISLPGWEGIKGRVKACRSDMPASHGPKTYPTSTFLSESPSDISDQ